MPLLRDLAQDTLRFTMYFFYLIQQSTSHIYHSALPLSPRLSRFHSKTLSEKTKITGFYGRADAWGIVVRTITASSKHFTCMATFGHQIAAACNDGTVGIYDSITGVLRLSLSLDNPVQAIRGSPDGSILFCAHKTPSITAWDMQTGGLIHTFVLERNAKDIDVSSKGHYLACGLFGVSVEVWDVPNKIQGATIRTRSPGAHFCWLKPEEWLAVSTAASVIIRDVVAGTVLHSYTIRSPVHRMVYSQKFNQLATLASSAPGSAITIIDPQTGPSTSHWIPQSLSCFSFSQTAEVPVCGVEAHGLQMFDIPTQRSKHIEYPDSATSVSSLQNGTMVANFARSGIHLLNLDGGQPPTQLPTISALSVHIHDEDRIIAIFPTSRDHIVLLGPAIMSQVLKIPVRNSHLTPTGRTTILCASQKNLMAVHYFEDGDTGFLQLWRFHEEVPRWTVEVDRVVELGRISPTAVRLVTLHTVERLDLVRTHICLWNTHSGGLDAWLEYAPLPHPFDVKFTSDTEFWLNYSAICKFYTIKPCGLINDDKQPRSLRKGSQKRRYLDIDDAHEWVVSGSKRVCWIPPGYIGSVQHSYCWVGCSLIMVGRDGTLRKLTFSDHHVG